MKIQEARDKILDRYLDQKEAAARAKQEAQEEKEREEDAIDNYTISFSYNVRGLSK